MMKTIRYLILCFLCNVMITQWLYAQKSFGGLPLSFKKIYLSENVPTVEIPAEDIKVLKTKQSADKGTPYHIGNVKEVFYTMNNIGMTDILPDGSKLWRVSFEIKEATFLNISFKDFDIPEDAELFLYTPDKKFLLGKFTAKSALENQVFYTQSVPGERVVLEYYEPTNTLFGGSFTIDKIAYGFADFFKGVDLPFGISGPCQVNVKCEEESWKNQINSVVCFQLWTAGGMFMCSGALINNMRNDRTPYIFTADHCLDNYAVTKFITYFNYQTNGCRSSTGTYGGAAIGMEIVAHDNSDRSSDFALLKITGEIDSTYDIYFAGWDRSTGISPLGACIHHPAGDFKKISIPFSVRDGKSIYAKYWEVYWIKNPNKGVTESGSSGSPLFNRNKQIIGSLHGGNSSCDNLNGSDYYGKFSNSWKNNNNSSPGRKLQPWLDPDNTDAMQCGGVPLSVKDFVFQPVKKLEIYPNPTKGVIIFGELPQNELAKVNVYNILSESVYTTSFMTAVENRLDLSFLKTGIYVLEITIKGQIYSSKVVIV